MLVKRIAPNHATFFHITIYSNILAVRQMITVNIRNSKL